MQSLNGKRVAILSDNGFEEVELTSPRKALEEAGAQVDIVSAQKDKIKAWDQDHWSIELDVNVALDDAKVEDYDAYQRYWQIVPHGSCCRCASSGSGETGC